MPTKEQRTDLATAALRSLITKRRAVVWPEVEAALAEPLGPVAQRFDPHVLTQARQRLRRAGELISETKETRGARTVTTLSIAGPTATGRTTAAVRARKRLLYARYLGWASGTVTREGVTGKSLERAVHASIRDAAPSHGYLIENPDTGQTPSVAGVSLMPSYGPTDNAFLWRSWSTPTRVAVIVEAKNLRDWIYPPKYELYQLLSKGAYLASKVPKDVRVLPVLVCRRAHKTTFRMAKEMGFYVIDVRRQIISLRTYGDPDADRKLKEVRAELGFFDLIQHEGAHDTVTKHFRDVLPVDLAGRAETWTEVGARFETEFVRLAGTLSDRVRRQAVRDLNEQVKAINDLGLPW